VILLVKVFIQGLGLDALCTVSNFWARLVKEVAVASNAVSIGVSMILMLYFEIEILAGSIAHDLVKGGVGCILVRTRITGLGVE